MSKKNENGVIACEKDECGVESDLSLLWTHGRDEIYASGWCGEKVEEKVSCSYCKVCKSYTFGREGCWSVWWQSCAQTGSKVHPIVPQVSSGMEVFAQDCTGNGGSDAGDFVERVEASVQ